MIKKWLKEWTIIFCVSFTCIVLGIIIIDSLWRGELTSDYGNILLCFFWTGIAILTLALYPLLEKFPFWLIVILQYSIAMGIVFLSIGLGLFFDEIHPNAYRDAFRSFTLFYVLGGSIFYITEKRKVRQQNKLLTYIKEMKKKQE